MTYNQALIGEAYAQRIDKVLKGLEWVCPNKLCDEGRIIGRFVKNHRIECSTCSGTGKIHYSWIPQPGEWIRYKLGNGITIRLIRRVISQNKLLLEPATLYLLDAYSKGVTPILEWEVIIKILAEAGILFRLRQTPDRWMPPEKFYCDVTILHKDASQAKEFISLSIADSRIRAVYDAVLALDKEIK